MTAFEMLRSTLLECWSQRVLTWGGKGITSSLPPETASRKPDAQLMADFKPDKSLKCLH